MGSLMWTHKQSTFTPDLAHPRLPLLPQQMTIPHSCTDGLCLLLTFHTIDCSPFEDDIELRQEDYIELGGGAGQSEWLEPNYSLYSYGERRQA